MGTSIASLRRRYSGLVHGATPFKQAFNAMVVNAPREPLVSSMRLKKRSLLTFAALWIGQLLLATAAAAQVIHTSHDHIPDFSANPTVTSAANGGWSTASTWSPARVPGPNDIVRIRHAVTFDTTAGDVSVVG